MGHIVQSIGHLTEEPEIQGSILSQAYTFVNIDHEIFSTVIFPHLLIQEGQLSVTGESMGT